MYATLGTIFLGRFVHHLGAGLSSPISADGRADTARMAAILTLGPCGKHSTSGPEAVVGKYRDERPHTDQVVERTHTIRTVSTKITAAGTQVYWPSALKNYALN
jgi:hypothetical protein